jgi:hypothetical protein
MLGKPLELSNNHDRQRASNPALWFYLTLKQSGFVCGKLAMDAE